MGYPRFRGEDQKELDPRFRGGDDAFAATVLYCGCYCPLKAGIRSFASALRDAHVLFGDMCGWSCLDVRIHHVHDSG